MGIYLVGGTESARSGVKVEVGEQRELLLSAAVCCLLLLAAAELSIPASPAEFCRWPVTARRPELSSKPPRFCSTWQRRDGWDQLTNDMPSGAHVK
jgi:hypothetical protein